MKLLLLWLVLLLVGCSEVGIIAGDAINGHENEIVNVRGIVHTDKMMCTKMACSEDDPCCNGCRSGMILDSEGVKIYLDGIECTGNNCEMDCQGLVDGKEYTIRGTYSVRRNFKFIEYMRYVE